MQELTQSGPAASPTGYGYDRANDLTTRAAGSGGAISQAFDADSQLCWSSPTAVSGPACTSAPAGAIGYSYDTQGDRTAATPATGTATSYSYDEAKQLTGYTDPTGVSTHYVYDGSGLRASTATGAAGTNYDTWDLSAAVPLLLSDGPHKFIYGPGGVPIEQITTATATVTYLHTDQAGSVRLLTDTSGTVTGSYSYDPWGQTTAHTGTGTTPLGYDGQYTDPESGLIYLRARYYDPQTAQFLTLDPAVAVTGQPYSYTGNDPLNAADPTGLGCLSGFRWAYHAASTVGHIAKESARAVVDVTAVVPYALYYGSYYAAKETVAGGCAIHACWAGHIAALPWVPLEGIGLGGDIALDWLKQVTGLTNEDWADESTGPSDRRPINPLHGIGGVPSPLGGGPSVYLPGVSRRNGCIHVDFAW